MCLEGRYFRPRGLFLQKYMLARCLSEGTSAMQTFEWAVSRCLQHMLMQCYLEPLQPLLESIYAHYLPALLAVLTASLPAVSLCLAEAAAVSSLVEAHRQ